MRRRQPPPSPPAPRLVRWVIVAAAIIGLAALVVPASQPPPAKLRVTPTVPETVIAAETARARETPPEALRQGTRELRIVNGQPPPIPRWQDGRSKEDIAQREAIARASRDRVPPGWDSVDRPVTERYVQDPSGIERKAGAAPPAPAPVPDLSRDPDEASPPIPRSEFAKYWQPPPRPTNAGAH
jgi:hypothetical protein